MGQTHDLSAGITESPVHAVTVGAVSPGDGNLAVPDGDDVGTGVVSDGEFLIHPQVDGPDNMAVGSDFCHAGRGSGSHKIKA